MADITYVRLEREFVYLGVIRDAFSRRVIGLAPDRTLEAEWTVQALRMRATVGVMHQPRRRPPLCDRR